VRGGVIDGVAFTGRGCAISQASASLLTDEVKGKPVDKAQAMTSGDVLDLLGIEISPARMKCAMLSLETMQGAIGASASPAAPVSPDAAETAPAGQA
jgi:nitrogen fixation NifU-like protein